MSRTIDSKVVEMRFDNKQFESGVKETMSTLDRLKNALKFTDSAKGLEGLSKATKDVSLEGIAAGIDKLNQRFSVLGIAGMRIISNITDGLMNKLGSAIDFVSNSIVSGGVRRAMNIENAHFQLQSILNDEVRVQEVMNSANKSVDGTAYSFDVAAKAASQFTASGVNDVESLDVALRGLAGTTATYNADYESMAMIFTQVAGQGRLMGDQLLQLSTRGANAAVTIRDYVNGISDGSIEASENVKAAALAISNGAQVTEKDIRDVTSKGMISFDLFAASMEHAFGDSAQKANETFTGAFANIKAALARIGAGFVSPLVAQGSSIVDLFNAIRVKVNDVKKVLVFDEAIGNVHALSKQFSDFVLNLAGNTTKIISSMDITKPMTVVIATVETIINVFKGLYSILKPVGQAFKEVFLNFNGDDIVNFSVKLKQLTDNFRLSETGGKNLHDAMKGLFSIIKAGIDLFLRLVSALFPVNISMGNIGEGALELAGSLGRMLESFSNWLRTSPAVSAAFDKISSTVQTAGKAIAGFVLNVVELVRNSKPLETFNKALKDLGIDIRTIDLTKPHEVFEKFASAINKLLDAANSNEGIAAFVRNIKEFTTEIKNAFSKDNITDKVESLMSSLGKFVDWIKNTFAPVFKDFSIGGAIAAGGGIGMIYSFIKAGKALEKLASSIKVIPDTFGAIKGVLNAWQNDLKADTIFKIASAIGVLAGSLVLLSFADPDRLMNAAKALALVGVTLAGAFSALMGVVNAGKKVVTGIGTLATMLNNALNKLLSSIKIKAIGSAVKKFAESIAIIAVSIIALGVMYRKDKDSLMAAVDLIKDIGIVLAAAMALGTILGQFAGTGMKNFNKAASGVRSLALSAGIIVLSLNTLFKMTIPDDWQTKLGIFAGVFVGIGALAVILGIAGRIAGGGSASALAGFSIPFLKGAASGAISSNGGSINAGSILALAAMLYTTVAALDKLFKMTLPPDWQEKVTILGLMFVEVAGLMIALGVASRIAGGSMKAATTILAVAGFLVVAVGALMILSIFPGEALLKGAVALGAVLIALGVSLSGAAKVSSKETAKTVLAMAGMVGAIVAALGVLSMISGVALLKAAIALGSILLVLSKDFSEASKVGKDSFAPLLAMIAAVGVIAYSLYELSLQPWEGMLASGLAMSATMLAFAEAFKIVSNANDIDAKKIGMFLAATLAVIPIGIALYELSNQLWSGMLAAGVALSMTVLAFAEAFAIISSINPNIAAIGTFLLATLAVVPIGVALYELSKQNWQDLLGTAASITLVLTTFTGVLAVCTAIGPVAEFAAIGVASLYAFILSFGLLLLAMGSTLNSEGAKALISGGIDALVLIGEGIGKFVGAIIGSTLEQVSSTLPDIADNLSEFMGNLQGFIEGSKQLDISALANVGVLTGIIYALTGAEFLNGIASLFGLSMEDVAKEISKFAVALLPFVGVTRQFDESTLSASKYIAEMVLALTAAELISGIGRFLGIGGSLAQFGEELASLGPNITTFSDQVKGIDPASVEGAASACKIMAEAAKTLPGTDGLMQKIFGSKSLAEFGEELASFGPHIAEFADQVKDVDPAAVEGAASVTQIMSTLANDLPAQDGLVQKIMGSKSIADFGSQLVQYGEYVTQFVDSIKDLNAGNISSVVAVTSIMSQVADGLPSSDSLWQKLFGGGNSISSFGQELVKFGGAMQAFSASVAGINLTAMSGSVEAFKTLADLSQYVSGSSAQNIKDFADKIGEIGTDCIDKFTQAFSQGGVKVNGAITTFMSTVNSVFVSESLKTGQKMDAVAKNIIDGLTQGLNSRIGDVQKAAASIASTVDNTIRGNLEIHSPSKLTKSHGENAGLGVAEGLSSTTGKVKEATSKVTDVLKDTLSKGVDLSYISQTVYGESLQPIVQATETTADKIEDVQEQQEKTTKQHVTNQKKTAQELVNIQNVALSKEEMFWNNLLAIRKQGEDAEKYQNMTMVEFQKQFFEEVNEIVDNYRQQYLSTREEVFNSFDLFTEVEQKETKSKKELKNILDQQIHAYEEYAKVMEELNGRLDGTKLIEELRSFGVDSTAQLKVINSMTDEELSQYSLLFDQKWTAASDVTQQKLVAMEQETTAKLNELFGSMYSTFSWQEFGNVFDGSIESLNQFISEVFIPLEDAGQRAAEASKAIPEGINSGISEGLLELGTAISEPIESALQESLTSSAETATTMSTDIGTNINTGIAEGMSDTSSVEASSQEVMNSILDSLQSAGEIHSPSALMQREVGTFITEGVAEGMIESIDSVSESSTQVMNAIIESFQSAMPEIEEAVQAIVTSMGNTFTESATSMQEAGKSIPQSLSDGIKSNQSVATNAGTELGKAIVDQIRISLPDATFRTNGQNIVQNIVNGMNTKKPLALSTVKNICTSIINEFRIDLPSMTFQTFGSNMITWIIQGMESKRSAAISSAKSMADAIIAAFRETITQQAFFDIGANAAMGLKNGIESKIDEIKRAAIRAAREAIEAAKEELDEASPSKVFHQMGEFVSIGLANGIIAKTRNVSRASTAMADEAIDAMQDAVQSITSVINSEDFVTDPVIRPIMDLSDVQKGAEEIGSLFDQTFDLSSVYNDVLRAASSFGLKNESAPDAKSNNAQNGGSTNYTFNQYNTSPKALSRSEIYRQTSNQFSQFRKAVSPA